MGHFTVSLSGRYPFLAEGGRAPYLETYLPFNLTEMQRENDRRPTILLLPGGAYRFCSQREAEPIALNYLPAGYNVVILWYSCKPHRHPVQLIEVASAMETLYENAEAWHIDTEKIAIMGFSAGGHLAAHYTNRFDCEEVRRAFPDSKPVNASILGYPVITGDPDHRTYAHTGSFKNLLGCEELSDEDAAAFSCERMVTERTPPTFLWCTRTDASVSVMNSLLYAEALAKHDVPFSLHVYPAGKHGLATVDAQTNPPEKLADGAALAHAWLEESIKWLDLTFGR